MTTTMTTMTMTTTISKKQKATCKGSFFFAEKGAGVR
jgi:hypothetical protein